MSHSLIGADRSTHLRIVALAAAAALSIALLAGATARAELAGLKAAAERASVPAS